MPLRPLKQSAFGSIACLFLIGLPSVAQAVDLKNEDRQSYAVALTEDEKVRKLRLRPDEFLSEVCKQCLIAIQDIGEIKAEPGDLIIIRGGRFELKS